jgi:hypothetical protein
MKKSALFLIFLFSFIANVVQGQAGMWTWMNGDTLNSNCVYGPQGVFNSAYHPQGTYEGIGWTDLKGNFWYSCNSDTLWKFDPLINQWAWIFGHGSSSPYYGIKGVPSPLNTPGSRIFCSLTWTDTVGDLWLFGGRSWGSSRADLWKYNIASNEWTWMSGSNTLFDVGNYGIKGIPSTLNYPCSRIETNAGWLDRASNSLWLFGGNSGFSSIDSALNDVWKYHIATNEWTWMHGDSTSNDNPPNFGIKNISSPSNDPGSRDVYCKWSDKDNNLWFFGGGKFAFTHNDTWKYDIVLNEWTWMGGNVTPYSSGNCITDTANVPKRAYENKTCWVDVCGKFWKADHEGNSSLWKLDPDSVIWTLVNGSLGPPATPVTPVNYGQKGIPNITNHPNVNYGVVSWTDVNNNFWFINSPSVMWRYTPDTSCGGCVIARPFANYSSTDSSICVSTCISFNSLSQLATSYQWSFPEAIPSTSNDINPSNICYPDTGHFDVTLIVMNVGGSDTLTITNFVTVSPFPTGFAIVQISDTLFATQNYASYQWYYFDTLLAGANNYFYVPIQNGTYRVSATDSNGCDIIDSIVNVTIGINESMNSKYQLKVFPNPNNGNFVVEYYSEKFSSASLEVFNMLSEKVYREQRKINVGENKFEITQNFVEGIYFLNIRDGEKMMVKKVVIQK